MDLKKTHGIEIDSWYIIRLMVQTWTHGIGKDSWYGHRLMVLTTPMVLTKTHGIVSVLLNHTLTRGPSVTRMRDFFLNLPFFTQSLSHSVTQSLSHSVTQSLSHLVTQSLSHSVTHSLIHSIAQSLRQ